MQQSTIHYFLFRKIGRQIIRFSLTKTLQTHFLAFQPQENYLTIFSIARKPSQQVVLSRMCQPWSICLACQHMLLFLSKQKAIGAECFPMYSSRSWGEESMGENSEEVFLHLHSFANRLIAWQAGIKGLNESQKPVAIGKPRTVLLGVVIGRWSSGCPFLSNTSFLSQLKTN